ncbi:hypothetical protein ACR79M_09525 [Sphingobacterium spiritivorum]|uniref:hypothetical protein n=1 Tax=Sphingobacterium TaxID=28453 RepID=UPI0025EDF873|nr:MULTISPECIES: hypothetical protein [unclassified Sphingobacterium]
MDTKKMFGLIVILCLCLSMAQAQQIDERRMRIEMTVRQGNEEIIAPLTSATISFNRGLNETLVSDSLSREVTSKEHVRLYDIGIALDRQNIKLLSAFIKNKNGLNGHIVLTDTYKKLPSRKIEFTSAVLDALNDQFTNDYSSAYMSIRCGTLIIDGLDIKP